MSTNIPPFPIPNPIAPIVDWLGSANVQKLLGLAQVGIAGLTDGEAKTIWPKIAAMSIGGVFTIAVHAIDAVRAKIEADKTKPVVVS